MVVINIIISEITSMIPYLFMVVINIIISKIASMIPFYYGCY